MPPVQSEERLQRALEDITRLLEKHQLLEQLAQRQEGPRRELVEHLQHRQNIAELQKHLRLMHPADIAFALEALAPDERAPALPVIRAMTEEAVTFGPHDDADAAAKAFERYNLVSAPVIDDRGKLVGRLTVDAVMDFVRDETHMRALKEAGLSGDEDLFGGPWQSARNRWPWLAISLVTAFVASRVIGRFEGEIQSLGSLAALMPIVASIGGNTGNQTMALVIRGLALDRIQADGARRIFYKELGISLINGLVWGLAIGLAALALYSNLALGIVMSSAVVLNLIVAALAGVFLL